MRLASAGRTALLALLPLLASAAGPRSGEGSSAPQQPSPFAAAMAAAESALERGELDVARREVLRALERDGKSARAWELRARLAERAGLGDEEVYCRHRELELCAAQDQRALALERRGALIALDPVAGELFGLRAGLIAELEPLAAEYEKQSRPHSAIGVHRAILALAPDHAQSDAAIVRLSALPDPSLAEHAEPRDLLADVSAEWIREFDAEHATWDERAKHEGASYNVYTDAGYEVLVRCAEAMDQMNAFYREFFQYGVDGGSVPRIDLLIFKRHDEYLKHGSGPPVEWSGGQFTGGSVETHAEGGFGAISETLFHEAAHQFVSLATNSAGWLNEGLASFFEGCRLQANGTVLMNMPATHRLLPLVLRLEAGWMNDAADGIDPEHPEVEPGRAPTLRILIEDAYEWGPAWYAPTWGLVYFLYNYQDPLDGRFVYRAAFREFVDKSGGRVGGSAVENFEKIVLGSPAKPFPGVEREGDPLAGLPRTAEECDELWKSWLIELRDRQIGRAADQRPYLQWARCAVAAKETATAVEHFEKGLLTSPEDVSLLCEFAELLIASEKPDRASVLLSRAARVLESATPVDSAALKAVDALLAKADPRHASLARVQERLSTEARAVVERYAAAEMPLMVMHVSQKLSTELGVPGLMEPFGTALRASSAGLDLWELAYDEASLEGWGVGDDTFRAAGPVIESRFGSYSNDAYDYRVLTLERVTSSDYSLEAEVRADSGRVGFAGLAFGRKSPQNFHALVLFPPRPQSAAREGLSQAGWVDLASFYGDNASTTWRHTSIPAADTETGAGGTWHKLRIDVVGSVADAWVDDEWIATQSFASSDVLSGGFGLITGPGEAQFRELRFLSRAPGDPTSAVQRALRLEGLVEGETAIADSYLDAVPPWPRVARWVQGERKGWKEAGPVPQLLVLWSIDQNERIPIDAWLGALAQEQAELGLAIVAIASPNDADKLETYLAEHAFPGAVGIDLRESEGFGLTNEAYSTPRFGLPRLILLDIDQKVVWEGDPGFRAGAAYQPSKGSFLDAPLDELVARRKLRSLSPWVGRWESVAVPALHAGDFGTALPILRESFAFEATLIEAAYGAQRAVAAVESAVVSLAGTGERLAAEGREPALGVLLEWAGMLAIEAPKDAAAAVRALRASPGFKDWERAQSQISAWKKRIEKDLAQAEELAVRLEELAGTFPRELAAEVRAAIVAGDAPALLAVLESAPEAPRTWLARRFFGW